MSHRHTRRKFIQLAGSAGIAIVSTSLLECNSSSKKSKETPGKPVNRVSKRRKPPVNMTMVQNRGWYINTKNNKIHYFDKRGFTPSLKYFKNSTEFDRFTQHLQPYDPQQLTPEIFYKQVSKKNKDWVTEYAALAFLASRKFADAFSILQDRIQKKKAINYRLMDLASIVSLRSNDSTIMQQYQQLISKYENTNDKKFHDRLSKYSSESWQTKIKEREVKWNDQTI